MEPSAREQLIQEYRDRRRDLARVWVPVAVLTLIGFAVAWLFMEPAPPRRLALAAGPHGGVYDSIAQQYAKVFARHGIEIEIRHTAGSIENYELLADDQVSLAIVQGGTAPPGIQLEAIASLYLEPLWVFYRHDKPLTELREFRGMRIGIGTRGSGTHAIAEQLFQANGMVMDAEGVEAGTSQFVEVDGPQSADRLIAGELDAVCFVIAPDAAIIRRLLQAPDVRLLSFSRQRAYARRFPFLSSVILEQGVLDLEHDLPRESVRLIAPAANLVATARLNDAFVPLLLDAAHQSHSGGDLLIHPGTLPSLDHIEFPPNETARQFFVSGPSFLQRYLPFWVASFIDRMKIMVLPLITLAIPLIRMAPPVYRWRIRSRIYRWYGILRDIDQKTEDQVPMDEVRGHLQTLNTLEQELEDVKVPLSFMEEFYNLGLHIDLVQRRLEELVARAETHERPL